MNTRLSKSTGFLLLIGLLLLAVMPLAAQDQPKPEPVGLRPDAPEYALHGPYWVGTMEMVIGEAGQPVTVWYPALNPDGKKEETTITVNYAPSVPSMNLTSRAIQDGVPDRSAAPYPLIVYSHTHLGTRLEFRHLTEHLASHGFVVLAADQMGDTWRGWQGGWEPLVNRMLATTRVIDFAESLSAKGGALEGLIDTQNAAVAGAVFGGWSALVAAGAQLDLAGFDQFCRQHPQSLQATPNEMCGIRFAKDDLAHQLGLKSPPEGLWPALGDARIRAVIPFSPYSAAPMFGQEGLKGVTVPTLLMAGAGPTLFPGPEGSVIPVYLDLPDYDTPKVYEYLSGPQKSLVLFDGGSQWLFFDSWESLPEAFHAWLEKLVSWKHGAYLFRSDPVWDMDRAHDLINHFTTAFLLDVLKGDEAAHAALAPDAVSFPGITYEAQGF